MKNLYIRADADAKIGAGHIMRSMALGQAWCKRGGKVTVFSCCQSERLRERIWNEGFELIDIPKPFPHSEDLKAVTETILKRSTPTIASICDWVVIDGYHFTGEYQKAIRDLGVRVMVMDDDAPLPFYHADIILNQNIHAPHLSYPCDPDTLKLLGTDYVLLRQEFLEYQGDTRTIPAKVEKILVTLGGSDPDNVTSKVVGAIHRLEHSGLAVKIIAGPANPHIGELSDQLAGAAFKWELLHDVKNMPELMAWADIAISAAGSTCWEICYMGLPSLLIVAADNQREIGSGLDKIGAALCLGWHEAVDEQKIYEKLKSIIDSSDTLRALSRKARMLVDGKGIGRVMARFFGLKVLLRKSMQNDCAMVWRWANDPQTRHASLNADPIPWEDHVRWFNKILLEKYSRLYILELDSIPLGQIRFEKETEDAWMISYSIAPEYRGFGLGAIMVRKGLSQMLLGKNHMTFIAKVKPDNLISKKIFMDAGFREITRAFDVKEKSFITYQLACAREECACEY
jgi:UDP-2,4-diacetamido-2,4,6-trideoxy-beta-L-altropyranose hydrolase